MSNESACETLPPARPACTALAFLDAIHGLPEGNPYVRFEARVAVGASLLGLSTALVVAAPMIVTGQWLQAALCGALIVALLVQLLAIRRGAPMAVMRWTVLGTAGVFLFGYILLEPRVERQQLYWLVLLPVAAQSFAAPHGSEPRPAGTRVPLVTLGLVVVLGALVIVWRDLGITPSPPEPALPRLLVALDFASFVGAVYGFSYVHGLAARDMQLELTQLRRVLSVCAWCKKIHARGDWVPFEVYLAEHESHALENGVCPSCYERDFWE